MTKYLREALNCNVYAVEIDEECSKIVARYTEKIITCDIESFEWFDELKDIKFDYILFVDVLEHLVNPEKVLKRSKSLMNIDTELIVSVPNIAHNAVIIGLEKDEFIYSDVGLLDKTHLKHFTYKTILELMDKLSLSLYSIDSVDKSPVETELANDYSESDNHLRKRKLGHVYQYVFNGKMRHELLNSEIFYTIQEAKILIEQWRKGYNTIMPHSSLGYRPPVPEVIIPKEYQVCKKSFSAWS